MPTGVIELIILAAIALFLLFRLRSVLGTKTGFEEQQHQRRAPTAEPAVRPAPAPEPVAEEGGVDADRMARAIEQTKSVYSFVNPPDAALYFDASYLPADGSLTLP